MLITSDDLSENLKIRAKRFRVRSFIKENNLEGKTIIPFCAHGTGGLAASLRDMGEVLPENCNFLKDEVFHVSRPEVKGARASLEKWLVELEGKLGSLNLKAKFTITSSKLSFENFFYLSKILD